YRSVNYNLVPGRTIFNQEVAGPTEMDVAQTVPLSWDQLLAGRKSGVVFLDAERVNGEHDARKPLGTQALIQLTDLGLVWKKAREGVEVFVFSHTTGQPVPQTSARLLGNENELLAEAATDASGLAHLAANT